MVVWQSFGSSGGDTAARSVQGQRYAAGGAALGGQFQVNTYTTNGQSFPSVAADGEGDFVVVWQSFGSSGGDTSYASVQGQRFRVTGDLQGRVFFDANANGLQNVGETGIAGVTVELYDDAFALRRTVVTDAIGEYILRPKEGNWILHFLAPPAWFTSPDVGGDEYRRQRCRPRDRRDRALPRDHQRASTRRSTPASSSAGLPADLPGRLRDRQLDPLVGDGAVAGAPPGGRAASRPGVGSRSLRERLDRSPRRE